jgi:hypothetical protein
MTCLDVLKLIYPYIDKELVDVDCKALEEHIRSCITCKEWLDHEGKTAIVVREHLVTVVKSAAPINLISRCQERLKGIA